MYLYSGNEKSIRMVLWPDHCAIIHNVNCFMVAFKGSIKKIALCLIV